MRRKRRKPVNQSQHDMVEDRGIEIIEVAGSLFTTMDVPLFFIIHNNIHRNLYTFYVRVSWLLYYWRGFLASPSHYSMYINKLQIIIIIMIVIRQDVSLLG
jgi:hypothetical protein